MEEVHIIAKPCCTQALCLIMANEMWEACLDLRFYLILFFFSVVFTYLDLLVEYSSLVLH